MLLNRSPADHEEGVHAVRTKENAHLGQANRAQWAGEVSRASVVGNAELGGAVSRTRWTWMAEARREQMSEKRGAWQTYLQVSVDRSSQTTA